MCLCLLSSDFSFGRWKYHCDHGKHLWSLQKGPTVCSPSPQTAAFGELFHGMLKELGVLTDSLISALCCAQCCNLRQWCFLNHGGYLLRLNIEWPHDTLRGIVENLWTVSSVPGKLEEPKWWQALFRTTALTSWGKTWEGELVFQFSSSPRGNFNFMFCTILFLKQCTLMD